MQFVWEGVRQAVHLIVHGDDGVWQITWFTLRFAAYATSIALLIGLPLGVWFGLGRARGRRVGVTLSNAGIGLPPVVVGVFLVVLMLPRGPLGSRHLLYTLDGIVIAQVVLSLPIVVAFTSAAVHAVPRGLLAQARAFGASTPQIWLLALREARVGVFAAAIAAVGSALSEVGAVILVGGNIEGRTQTLATAALQRIDAGDFAGGIAFGLILLGLILIIAALLTMAQLRGVRAPMGRAS